MGYLGAETNGIRTPGYVLAEMKTVNGLVSSLDRDIARNPSKTNNTFKEAWVDFKEEWDAFFKENSTGLFGGWLSRSMNSVYDKTQEYRALAMQWRDRFVRQGGDPSSNPLPEPKTFSIWPYVIGGGAAIGITYYLFRGPHDDSK